MTNYDEAMKGSNTQPSLLYDPMGILCGFRPWHTRLSEGAIFPRHHEFGEFFQVLQLRKCLENMQRYAKCNRKCQNCAAVGPQIFRATYLFGPIKFNRIQFNID